MKTFIIGIATLVMSVQIWYMTNCVMQLNRNTKELRFAASQASVSGALYIDNDVYQDKIIKFNDDQVVAAVKDIVCKNLELDNNQVPAAVSYWRKPVEITVYVYDDVSCREYVNGTFTRETTFSYPFLHQDAATGITQAIAKPTICVMIDAGKRPIGGGIMRLSPDICRFAAHEITGR